MQLPRDRVVQLSKEKQTLQNLHFTYSKSY